MYIDEIKVYAKAGHGGKGCIAFLREAYRPKGGPIGGDGGRGGNVILQADHDLNNLIAQFYEPRLIAEDGHPGLGKGMTGAAGKDKLIKVPCGTLVWRLPDPLDATLPNPKPALATSEAGNALVYDLESDDVEDEPLPHDDQVENELVADLKEDGQQFILRKGGRGGLGNRHFATARRQTPRFAQPGEPGLEGHYLLELRIMAEVGLIGYPNAGKSTLLTAISRARPKVAPYPFTTLHPQIGIVEHQDFSRTTVCDIPGLIEGAHLNVGLGHNFLRHVRRCRLLAIILDMAGTDGRNPWDDYEVLLKELEAFDPELTQRRRIVISNKMDEAASEENLKTFRKKYPDLQILQGSFGFGEGVEEFKAIIQDILKTLPPLPPIHTTLSSAIDPRP